MRLMINGATMISLSNGAIPLTNMEIKSDDKKEVKGKAKMHKKYAKSLEKAKKLAHLH